MIHAVSGRDSAQKRVMNEPGLVTESENPRAFSSNAMPEPGSTRKIHLPSVSN
jgi:hypothetical protein